MSIRELGYLLFGSKDLQGWKTFSETIVGFAASDAPDGALYLKMDERDFRLAILPDDSERLIASGWEVGGQDEFVALRLLLKESGTKVADGTAKDARLRRVQEFFSFSDPSGNRIEVFWGPISDFKPFRSPAGISSFTTAGLGLGHVVVPAADIEATQAFWSKTLGFNLSDILHLNFGGHDVKLYFNHCRNGRQHSMALAGMPSSNGCVHFMVEVPTLKDVGQALDRVQDAGLPLVMTLGQHVNDDCVSFYFQSPHGYMVEIGCDAVIKDWDRHSVFETTLPSHWGHRFVLNR
jgi:3,4-dihydroxy-9,10-secoandrosta-1,3,5(10)-triene-9,17-dione 4,5-dioxygenase